MMGCKCRGFIMDGDLYRTGPDRTGPRPSPNGKCESIKMVDEEEQPARGLNGNIALY